MIQHFLFTAGGFCDTVGEQLSLTRRKYARDESNNQDGFRGDPLFAYLGQYDRSYRATSLQSKLNNHTRVSSD